MSWLQSLPPIIRMAIEQLLPAQPVANLAWIEQKADQLVSAIGPLFLGDVQRIGQSAPSGKTVSTSDILLILAAASQKLAKEIEFQARQPPTEINLIKLRRLQDKYNAFVGAMSQVLQQENQRLMSVVRGRD